MVAGRVASLCATPPTTMATMATVTTISTHLIEHGGGKVGSSLRKEAPSDLRSPEYTASSSRWMASMTCDGFRD